MSAPPLLSVRNLVTTFQAGGGAFNAVKDVSFDLAEGEVLGIVGESGSGKSVTALSILQLIPNPPGEVTGGEILFRGEDLVKASRRRMRQVRGAEIAMIFQEPMTSLNPVFSIGDQIIETIRYHERISRRAARDRAIELLDRVGIAAPAQRLGEYPHELSGGMRQRAMIAIALSCNPRLLLADEPTTALDVTIQAQILELLSDLREEFGMAIVLITHDLGVVAQYVDRVIVMYSGRVIEQAPVGELFETPKHPYTEGLLGSIASLDHDTDRLAAIPGTVPSPFDVIPGCRFAPRCGFAREACDIADPPLISAAPEHEAACIRLNGYDPIRRDAA
ncbi:ABC transporter ATP-binding protein [Acuticoccus sediminis]|uniref:ABC transporter ATP-binding protein n=1 Tax=Acuticoccus sediminis TaxID=2184697 RepID=UPI001CFD4D68|nr:ABC transporter ATP-binding protein [Acuticoccus sediminis]